MTATRSLRRMAARNSTGRPAAGTPLANKKAGEPVRAPRPQTLPEWIREATRADQPQPSRQSLNALVQASRPAWVLRSEEHTSELQSLRHLVCRPRLEKKK